MDNIVYGVGAGVRFVTPLGPIRLDWGYGLKFPSKGRSIVHFAMGQTF
ncbi:MAG: BamA/TamA family outer membrane protein [Candidatus Lindowbacteria bacterium]|nr:BamA/TamA family outer membrane protein [Candidatus Lindowbacteria bacterium]